MTVEVLETPLVVAGRTVATDHLGYLVDPGDWDQAVAEPLASREDLALGVEHLAVIALVREHYGRCHAVPEARTLLNGIRRVLGEERATRRYLHALFPCGYGPEVCARLRV
jgi:tRNA 2-thiouridine synthesizing protein E